jgi:hypothetical protein
MTESILLLLTSLFILGNRLSLPLSVSHRVFATMTFRPLMKVVVSFITDSKGWNVTTTLSYLTYETCPESKDTSRVARWGNFLCLLWQHCLRPWSFTCETYSFDSGSTGFVWVRHVWNGGTNPKSRQMRGAESCITSFPKCLRPQFMKLWQKN